MLKIKDNVNLKELEEFGFEYYKTIWASDDKLNNNEYILVDRFINIDEKVEVPFLQVYEINREIREIFDSKNDYCRVNQKRIDTLYDLIKADLVEKVEEDK